MDEIGSLDWLIMHFLTIVFLLDQFDSDRDVELLMSEGIRNNKSMKQTGFYRVHFENIG